MNDVNDVPQVGDVHGEEITARFRPDLLSPVAHTYNLYLTNMNHVCLCVCTRFPKASKVPGS